MQNILWVLSLIAATLWGLKSERSPPVTMIVISVWIFLTAKIQSFQWGSVSGSKMGVTDLAKWCLLTPTLDHSRIVQVRLAPKDGPGVVAWARAVASVVAGLILFCIIAPRLLNHEPLAAGWIAMSGIVLWLHFGALGLIVLFWRHRGFDLQPLMNAPLFSTSLSEFWGRRWNTAFRDFAHQQIFRPVCRRWNGQGATLISFLFSGLIHELAISVPAGGGYGLPTVYFLLQHVGVLVEKKAMRCGWAVGSGGSGWLFAAAFVLLPAGLLFHSAFVLRVIVPLIPFTV
jgi:alginate O-acetyltransferase complex protein AlgI